MKHAHAFDGPDGFSGDENYERPMSHGPDDADDDDLGLGDDDDLDEDSDDDDDEEEDDED